jgi:hypothetical protein
VKNAEKSAVFKAKKRENSVLILNGQHALSISRLVSSGAANKIEIAAADNYLSLRDQ